MTFNKISYIYALARIVSAEKLAYCKSCSVNRYLAGGFEALISASEFP